MAPALALAWTPGAIGVVPMTNETYMRCASAGKRPKYKYMCEERSVLAADAVQSANRTLALDASSRSSREHFGPYSEAGLPGSTLHT